MSAPTLAVGVQRLANAAGLVDACRAVGLVVTRMEPSGEIAGKAVWTVALWTPTGGLWMEAAGVSASSVLDAVALWRDHAGRASTAARVSVS